MCRICHDVKAMMETRDPQDVYSAALQAIENAIRAGQAAEHFTDVLDGLLGTRMEDRDPDIETAWEKSYRRGFRS